MDYQLLNRLYNLTEEEWATKNTVVLDQRPLRLRYFGGNTDNPVLILPPQAGHSGTLADYSDNQSLVQLFMVTHDVYVTEWQSVAPKDRYLGIDDYIRLTNDAVDKIGKPVLLVGQCQGGWQAAIYASLFPEKVTGLIIAASPIDVKADYCMINYCADNIPEYVFQGLVDSHGGLMPGKLLLMGFKSMQPEYHYFQKYVDINKMILEDDTVALERHIRFNNWYETTHFLAGRFYMNAINCIFKKNMLVTGGLIINGMTVNLKNIHCPIALIAGEKDHITPVKQVFDMDKIVSTSSDNIIKLLSNGGHIGTLMGTKSLREVWPKAIEFMIRK